MRERVYDGFFKVDRVETPDGIREVVQTTDSLSLLIVCDGRAILVRQSRAAMMTEENPDGMITETCAGRFDGDYTPLELAVMEAEQETGIQVQPQNIDFLNGGRPMAVSAGAITERSYLAWAEIDGRLPRARKSYGNPAEGERITRIELSVGAIPQYLQGKCEDIRVFTLLSHYWNWNNRRPER